MLTFVTWKWPPRRGYRSTFGPNTVNTLKAMVDRHYAKPHRFVCVTDDAEGIDPAVEILPDWHDFEGIPSPHGAKHPSCYRRLRMFHPDAAQWFGERFVSLDLDIVITGDLSPLFDRPEPIVFWGDTNPLPGSHYNGSIVLMSAGARPQVWNDFDPRRSPMQSRAARCFGSDQGWISYRLGPGEAKWTTTDGVYSFRNHLQQSHTLPQDARIVVFHGATDPWSPYARNWPWVRQHYRLNATVAA